MGQTHESSSAVKHSPPGINIEDLSLPKSIVARLAKAALPANTQIQSNAMLGLTKSATLFINYIASQANEIAAASNRKTVNANDVFTALGESEFASWRSRLEAELQKHTEIIEKRKEKVKPKDICGEPTTKKVKRVKVNPDDTTSNCQTDQVELKPSDNEPKKVKSSTTTEIDDFGNEDEPEKDDEDEDEDEDEIHEDENEDDEDDEEDDQAIEELEKEEEEENSDEALDNGEDSD